MSVSLLHYHHKSLDQVWCLTYREDIWWSCILMTTSHCSSYYYYCCGTTTRFHFATVVVVLKTTTLLLPLSSQSATLLFIVHILQQHTIKVKECINQDLEIEIIMLLERSI